MSKSQNDKKSDAKGKIAFKSKTQKVKLPLSQKRKRSKAKSRTIKMSKGQKVKWRKVKMF